MDAEQSEYLRDITFETMADGTISVQWTGSKVIAAGIWSGVPLCCIKLDVRTTGKNLTAAQIRSVPIGRMSAAAGYESNRETLEALHLI